MDYHTMIIGAGISGMTAAIYLKRAGFDVCIIEKSAPGGQLLRTSTVENYPGITKTEGSTIALNLYNQIENLQIPIHFEEVVSVTDEKDTKKIKTDNKEYTCKNIILATGRIYRKLELENEDKFVGKGISYCAICDGALYKNKKVAVIGAGNSAFEEALYLSNLCDKVTIISRRDEFRAEINLIEEIKNKDNIEIMSNYTVQKLLGDVKLEKLIIQNEKTKEISEIEVDGCFVYIGQTPDTEAFKNLNLEESNGYIQTDEFMQTNIKGIYACGDCREKDLYQLVTATYDGAVAADTIIKNKERED